MGFFAALFYSFTLLAADRQSIEGRAEVHGQPVPLAHACAFEIEDPITPGLFRYAVVISNHAPSAGLTCREVYFSMKHRELRDKDFGLRVDIAAVPSPDNRWEDGELFADGKSHPMTSFFGYTKFRRSNESDRNTLRGRLWCEGTLRAGGGFPPFTIEADLHVAVERIPPAGQHLTGWKAVSHPAAAVVKSALLAMSVGHSKGVRAHLINEETRQAYDRHLATVQQDPAWKYQSLMASVAVLIPVRSVVDLGGVTRVTLRAPGAKSTDDVHFFLRKADGKWRLVDF